MIKHLKLSSLNILLGATIFLLGCILIGGIYTMRSQVEQIDQSWHTYMVNHSEKARLESSLRAAIGYGGMIHTFKNFILRADASSIDIIHGQIDVALGVVDQYATLHLSQGETIALDDIAEVLTAYDFALESAQVMHQEGATPLSIDQAVMIDDGNALRGFGVLEQEVLRMANGRSKDGANKGRHIARLRAAIGYGGMIHHYKNYILRQDKAHFLQTKKSLSSVRQAIQVYGQKPLTEAEKIALHDIETVRSHYEDNLLQITKLIQENRSRREIDEAVKIDDVPALRGLKILDREVASETERNIQLIDQKFKKISSHARALNWSLVFIIFIFIVFFMWIYKRFIMHPILQIESTMQKLADDDLDIVIRGTELDNELGSMSRSLKIFNENGIVRRASKQQLAIAHKDLQKRLHDIQILKEEAEKQTNNAIELARNMDKARITAEEAIDRAEKDEKKVSSILNTVTDAILTIDHKGIIESFNPGAEIMFGYRTGEIIGNTISLLMDQSAPNQSGTSLIERLQGDKLLQETSWEQIARRKNETHFPVEITLNKMNIGHEQKFTCVIHDITQRRRAEEEIRRLALTDPLTTLANRNQFNIKFEEFLAAGNRFGHEVALLILDLDKFKSVNDTYGHPVGDGLLVVVAKLLKNMVRAVDLVARLGGDEFAIILNGVENGAAAGNVAEKVVAAIGKPLEVQGHTLEIGGSVGVSMYPHDADTQTELIRCADLALYHAKDDGRNKYSFYNTDLEPSSHLSAT